MSNVIEVIFGDSTFFTMSNSSLNLNKIIKFNTLFSIGDVSNINNYKIIVPREIFNKSIYNFGNEMKAFTNFIKTNQKIRIWTSKKDSDCYILLLYLCNYLKEGYSNLYVVFVDELNDEFLSPAMLREEELENALKYERKLSFEDINNFSNEWEYIKNTKTDMRLMINNKLELVGFDYFDDIILEKLNELGCVKESKLVATLLVKYHIVDSIFVYLIDRLICKNKIKVIEQSESGRKFDNIIEIN